MPPGRIAKLFGVTLVVPLLCVLSLFAFSGQRISTGDIAGLCASVPLNAFLLGIPQIACFSLRASGKIAFPAFLGGLICADLLVVLFAVLFLTTPNDGDPMGWLFYFAACVPLVPLGMLLGRWAGGTTSRC
jgi:hypothetical protein